MNIDYDEDLLHEVMFGSDRFEPIETVWDADHHRWHRSGVSIVLDNVTNRYYSVAIKQGLTEYQEYYGYEAFEDYDYNEKTVAFHPVTKKEKVVHEWVRLDK